MILCICRGISEHTVRTTIRAGASTLDDIAEACAAGSDCGACLDSMRDLLDAMRMRRSGSPEPARVPA